MRGVRRGERLVSWWAGWRELDQAGGEIRNTATVWARIAENRCESDGGAHSGARRGQLSAPMPKLPAREQRQSDCCGQRWSDWAATRAASLMISINTEPAISVVGMLAPRVSEERRKELSGCSLPSWPAPAHPKATNQGSLAASAAKSGAHTRSRPTPQKSYIVALS